MAEDESAATTARALKSCVECRRRKIRCSWTKEHTNTCRRCEERGIPCVPQKPARSAAISKANSKARISRLEAEVNQLRNVVFTIQKKLNPTSEDGSVPRPTSSAGLFAGEIDFAGEQDNSDSEDNSSRSSEIVVQDRHSHLDPLFHNEWISTDAQQSKQAQRRQYGRTTAQRLEGARIALQALILTLKEVEFLRSHMSAWLALLQQICPGTLAIDLTEDINLQYSAMKELNVDPLVLATWLLALAITGQQIYPALTSPGVSEQEFRSTFPQAVYRTVESHILSHDSICGSVAGLETYLMSLRFNLMKGVIQKSWLGLRRIIAIAELIGLPRAYKLLLLRSPDGLHLLDTHTIAKARLWESICSIERLAGTLMHFPIATRNYPMMAHEPLVSNGMVNNITFWVRLGNIAVQVHDVDDLASTPGTESELYNQVLRLDSELRLLASETPRDWWMEEYKGRANPSHIFKFQYHCITMRLHLPFAVRFDPNDQFVFSRRAGVESCRRVASNWCELRQMLPGVSFLSRPFDAQAFIASVILLLNSYNDEVRATPPSDVPKDYTDALLSRVIDLMDLKSKDPLGGEYAQQAGKTLRSLISLLNGHGNGANNLTLKVPLLGTITIRRKADKRPSTANSRTLSFEQTQTSAVQPLDSLPLYQVPDYAMNEFQIPYSDPELPYFSSNSVDDVFSWVVNPNDELLFHDNLMFEDGFTQNQWPQVY